jgi:tetratricopeptide (TPR) repeat protein
MSWPKEMGWQEVRSIPPVFLPIVRRAEKAFEQYWRRPSDATPELNQAIAAWQTIVRDLRFPATECPFRRDALNRLSIALAYRARAAGGELDDLDTAISLSREALELARGFSPEEARYLHNLGSHLNERYHLTGDEQDLRSAVSFFEKALKTVPADDVDNRLLYQSSLGSALLVRFEHTGVFDDLRRAVLLGEQTLADTSRNAARRHLYLSRLSQAVYDEYLHSKDLKVLDRTISLRRQAIDARPNSLSERSTDLGNLGNVLIERYKATLSYQDLKEAHDQFRLALELTPPGSPLLGGRLLSLGNIFWLEYHRSHETDALNEAIRHYDEGIRSAPSSLDLDKIFYQLARACRERHYKTAAQDDLLAAVSAFREACHTGINLSPDVTLDAGREWGAWAAIRGAWNEATEAYQLALQAIRRLSEVQLLRSDKEMWLRTSQGLSSRAAYAAAADKNTGLAVSLFEGGRAILLREALGRNRADLRSLSEHGRSDLVRRYELAAKHWARVPV